MLTNIRVLTAAAFLMLLGSAASAQTGATWLSAESCSIISPAADGKPRVALTNLRTVDAEGAPAKRVTLSITIPSDQVEKIGDQAEVKEETATLAFDDGSNWTLPAARADAPNGTSFHLIFTDDIEAFLAPLGSSTEMKLTVPESAGGETIDIALDRSSDATAIMEKCTSM